MRFRFPGRWWRAADLAAARTQVRGELESSPAQGAPQGRVRAGGDIPAGRLPDMSREKKLQMPYQVEVGPCAARSPRLLNGVSVHHAHARRSPLRHALTRYGSKVAQTG